MYLKCAKNIHPIAQLFNLPSGLQCCLWSVKEAESFRMCAILELGCSFLNAS